MYVPASAAVAFPPPLRRAAGVLAVVQFLFFTTWIVYVVYLGELLDKAGFGRTLLPAIILADQVLFAFADAAMGAWADRIERGLRRLAPFVVGVNLLSCALFVSMPWLAGAGITGQVPFLVAIGLWVVTASVLRAPAFALLSKHAARPALPWLSALNFCGLALGGAIAPYLGLLLKGADPRLPFLLAGLGLAAAGVALGWAQGVRERAGVPAAQPLDTRPRHEFLPLLVLASFALGAGFQLHLFTNSTALYKQFVAASELAWFLPAFWVGASLLVFPAAAAAQRFGADALMALAAIAGIVAVALCALAPNLATLVAAQFLAGGAWGAFFQAGLTAASSWGERGKEGLFLGLWFSMLSLATLLRAGLGIAGMKYAAGVTDVIAIALWVAGALLALRLWRKVRNLPDNNNEVRA
jgi:MFS family permease